MKIEPLKQIQPLQCIKPLSKEPPERRETPLNEIELISYSTNICSHSMRILRGETIVKNREAKLQALMREATKIHSLLSQRDFYLHSTYTKSDTKAFYEAAGLKSHHIV